MLPALCPALSNVVTLRHNDAGTAILKAIHQGCKGRMLVTSDVGWRKRHGAPDLPMLPKAATTRAGSPSYTASTTPIVTCS